jgi:hypothetical protein
MTTYEIHRRTHEGLLAGLGLAAVWILAAAVRPASTFHLAPILIAGIVPLLGKKAGLRHRAVTVAGFVGLSIASASSAILALFDLLRGPSLLPFGNAFVEAIVFAAGTAVVAGIIARITPTTQGDTV